MPISWLDVILIIIMLVSGFLAMVRVFTREVLSIFSWAVAAVAALYLTPKYWQTVESYFPSPAFAQIGFAAGVFIITLIVVSLITYQRIPLQLHHDWSPAEQDVDWKAICTLSEFVV